MNAPGNHYSTLLLLAGSIKAHQSSTSTFHPSHNSQIRQDKSINGTRNVRPIIIDSSSVCLSYLPACLLPLRQKRGEGALQRVRVAANSVRGVAVVGALSVEAQIVGGRHEERLEQIILGDLVNLCRDI